MGVDLQPYIGKAMLETFQERKQEIAHGQFSSADRDFTILICGIFSDDFLSLSHLLTGVTDLPEKALTFLCHGYPPSGSVQITGSQGRIPDSGCIWSQWAVSDRDGWQQA